MKNILMMMVLTLTLSTSAMAEEQQVYSPYSQPTFQGDAQGATTAQNMNTQSSQAGNQYMVYPGREQYGDRYGYIPRHPGDYRDAVDRGQWQGGGGAQMPKRVHSGY